MSSDTLSTDAFRRFLRRFLRRWPSALPMLTLALALALASTLAGCGKKGDPEPPIRLIPKAATDLTVQQRGPEAILRLGYPNVTTAGQRLPGLRAVEVHLLAQPAPGGEAPQVAAAQLGAARLYDKLEGDGLAGAVAGDRLRVLLPLPQETAEEPVAYTFAVRFVAPGGEQSAFSNPVTLVPVTPPSAPAEVTLEPTADGVAVSWSSGGEGLIGYRVYRRDSRIKDYGEPLATPNAEAARYLDPTARFGERYFYSVTAVASRQPVIESALGAEREMEYRDSFPPPPPSGLVALAESGRVRLSWAASPAGDLAGYHVYRRDGGDGEFVRRTDRPVITTAYLEAGLPSGARFAYRVTAVDNGGNESVPSEVAETTVR